MDKPSSTSSSKWGGLPWAALFAIALLIAGELGTRWFFKPPHVSVETYAAHYPNAPLYGMEGSRACFRDRDQWVCTATQDMNIIPQQFPVDKPAGELRIAVIGASISWEGPRASKSEGNYPSRTLERVQQHNPGKALRLINLSVPGSGSSREVVRFREALEYEPDLFILHPHDTNEQRDYHRAAYVTELHSGLAGKLLYLNSVVVLKGLWSDLLDIKAPAATLPLPEETGAVDKGTVLERYQAGLREHVGTMLQLAKARSIPVILVSANRGDVQDLCGNGGRMLNAFYAEHVSGTRVQALDVCALFRAEVERNKRVRLFKDKIHYSAEGTRVVSTALASLVEAALPGLGPGPDSGSPGN